MSADVSHGGYYSLHGRMHCLDLTRQRFVVPDTGDKKENNLWLIVRYMKGCCVEDPD